VRTYDMLVDGDLFIKEVTYFCVKHKIKVIGMDGRLARFLKK
jgi:hypothetical protein